MSNYKLLALDMDGTTLNKHGQISDANRKSIKAASEKGIKISLISGRDASTLNMFAKELGIDGYMSAMNGNIIFNSTSGEILIEHFMDSDMVKKIINISKTASGILAIFIGNDTYVEDVNHPFAEILQKFTERPLINMVDAVDYLNENNLFNRVIKLAFLNEYDDLLNLKENQLMHISEELNMVFSLPFCLELFSKDAGKGESLKEIAKLYNIDRDSIIAMGDGENDIEMLKFAGLGIAPSNCMPTVIRHADEITTSNDRDAVSVVINKYLL